MLSELVVVYLLNLALAVVTMTVAALPSFRSKDPSYVDAVWGLGFCVVAVANAGFGDGSTARKVALVGLTSVWGLRLAGYLINRWRREGPDSRYRRMLGDRPANAVIWARVFLFQAVVLSVVSLPLQFGQRDPDPAGLTVLNVVGVVLAGFGILYESVADEQLRRFKAEPTNAGGVMDRGLWRYSRHPNYFGEICVWWGLGLVATTSGATAVSLLGPAVITFFLLRVSGVGLLERKLRKTRPEYAAYVASTSTLLPRPPRAVAPR